MSPDQPVVTDGGDVRVEELREPKERNTYRPPVRLDLAVAMRRRQKEGRGQQRPLDKSFDNVVAAQPEHEVINEPQHARLGCPPPCRPFVVDAPDDRRRGEHGDDLHTH